MSARSDRADRRSGAHNASSTGTGPGTDAGIVGDAAEGDVAAAVGIFAMLADATRVRIVLALRETEMAVGAIAEAVGKPVPAVSQHLAKLRLSAMVASRQEGTRVYYRLINDHAARLVMDAMHQAEHAASPDPPHHRTGGSVRGA